MGPLVSDLASSVTFSYPSMADSASSISRSITFQNEQLMGFSGAKVADVRCVCDDAEELPLGRKAF